MGAPSTILTCTPVTRCRPDLKGHELPGKRPRTSRRPATSLFQSPSASISHSLTIHCLYSLILLSFVLLVPFSFSFHFLYPWGHPHFTVHGGKINHSSSFMGFTLPGDQ